MSLDDAGKLAASAAALPGPPRLPFWRTVIQAYALWARNLPDLARACWLWLLLLAPFIAVVEWWRAPQMAALLRASHSGQPLPPDLTPLLTIAASLLSLFVTLPVAASIAVAWHRLVLRNEHPSSNIYLRLDSLVGGYMLLLLATWVPGRTVRLLMTFVEGGVAIWLVGALSFAFMFIVPRISLALPATAVERSDVTFYAAWQATGKNTWRMFLATIVCFLPAGVIGNLVFESLPLEASRTTITLVSAALGLLAIPLAMIPVGLLSLAYRHFFERSE